MGTEKARVLTPDKTELKLVVEEKLMQNIQRLRELSAHKNLSMSYAEIFLMSTEFMLEKIDPQRQEEKRVRKQTKEQEEKNKSTQSDQNKVIASSPENLRCLCRTHNAYAAVKIFGREKMRDFLPQIK